MIVGGMYAGKSTQLRYLYTKSYANSKSIYIKFSSNESMYPVLTEEDIKTHGNLLVRGYRATHLSQVPLDYDIYFLDELQFVKDLHKIYTMFKDKLVFATSLDMDYNGEPFDEIGELLCKAYRVEKLHTVCSCGERAYLSLKICEGNDRIIENEIDGFLPVCKKCYEEGVKDLY